MDDTRSTEPLEPLDVADAELLRAAIRKRVALREWRWPIVLFLVTLFTTLVVGGGYNGQPYTIYDLPLLLSTPSLLAAQLVAGMPFSLTLLGILISHEFGHYFTARWHGVPTTPPYVLPFPSVVGTLGAVIRMRGVIPTRNALIDIGASGPIAGFVVAVPLLVIGLLMSQVHPVPYVLEGLPRMSLLGLVTGTADLPVHALLETPSLLYSLAKLAVLGRIPAGSDVFLHPMALAAWFGLFITALNLLPVGQLDGGHVLFAVIGKRARVVGRVFIGLLIVLGLFAWAGWLLWALLAWKIVKTSHPQVDAPQQPLGPGRRLVAWIALALLLLTFTPLGLQIG